MQKKELPEMTAGNSFFISFNVFSLFYRFSAVMSFELSTKYFVYLIIALAYYLLYIDQKRILINKHIKQLWEKLLELT